MSFVDYDPEIPAGFQDADLLGAEYERQAADARLLHRQGICTHGWLLGPGTGALTAADIQRSRQQGLFPDRPTEPSVLCQDDIPAGQVLCLHCGQLVDDPLA